ncbi:Uncharacterised protein [Achromobacter kerstersii]|nr:Uncharacterised protein [Achromobacter kerstersii]
MMPVLGSMLRPGGRPVAEYVSLSLVSMSEKLLDTSTLMPVCASTPDTSEMAVETGPSLVPVMVTTSVAVDVAPLGSVIV